MTEIELSPSSQVPSLLAFPETREGPVAEEAIPDAAKPTRILVAGVGYTCLGDHSAGPELVERLSSEEWPPGVLVEDLSYGPIDVLFKLQSSPPFRAGVFLTAAARGRPPGTLERRRWVGASLPPDDLQARMAEAVTGVISLDNLLHILHHFGVLPAEVIVLEIEPRGESWGTEFSPPVESALEHARQAVRQEVERLLETEPAS
jgi:hydrogenase maturation protease